MKKFGFIAVLSLAPLLLLGGCDGPDGEVGIGGILDLNIGPGGKSGTYLTGRHAQASQELDVAQDAFDQVLARDPKNLELLQQAFQVALTAGDIPEARGLANRIVAIDENASIPRMALAMMALRDGDTDKAKMLLGAVPKFGFNLFVVPLIEAWVHADAGDFESAMAVIEELEQQSQLDGFAAHHRALILDFMGRDDDARNAYDLALGNSPNLLQLIRAKGHFLARTGDKDAALRLYKAYIARAPANRQLAADLAALETDSLPDRLMTQAAQGAASAIYDIARDIVRETGRHGASEIGLIFTRMALAADPEFAQARLLIAGLYEDRDRLEDALEIYKSIDDPYGEPAARRGVARMLYGLDRKDEAFATLIAAMNDQEDEVEKRDAGLALGHLYRVDEQFDKAADIYTQLITAAEPIDVNDWNLFYARGTAYERLKDWPKAEQDLQQALSLRPDEPLILNYLGYSWIDRGENLEKATRMVEQAVNLRPHDGHIVDSLGWAYYKMGNYKDAVSVLERAVQLQPGDPIINDHLGDALWRVGRRLEARYQWRHVLTLDPEPELETQLRAKLDRGLARAKVNLALHVTGRRGDGYHLLDSLVVFPDIADQLTIEAQPDHNDIILTVTGPFGDALKDDLQDNLVVQAAQAFRDKSKSSSQSGFAITLEKNLPIASGIGGGSSDAAATLLAVSKILDAQIDRQTLADQALTLGADVPVCLKAPKAQRMTGIGEQLIDVPDLPRLGILLVNPGVQVATGPVFNALNGRFGDGLAELPDHWESADHLVSWLRSNRNDLEAPAMDIAPDILGAVTALAQDEDVLIARMSGSGATVYALTEDRQAADRVAEKVSSAYPDWWVQAGGLG
ncbi:ispE [Symbiodinium microadriaticum]|nr:ispE [Symbiodinium microadriaticum]